MKWAVVERFNRTLKEKMFRYFTHSNTLRYLDILPKLIIAYNNRPHGSLHGMKPAEVNRGNQAKVRTILYGRYENEDETTAIYAIGDYVRISKLRDAFKKGYTRGWTVEIFRISDILDTKPITYKLVDQDGEILEGIFYHEELSRVRLD